MSSISGPIFSGSSTFSASFQQVLTRAVSIASLPLQQLQNNVSKLQSEQAAMASLEAVFSSLQNSIQNVAAGVQGNLGTSISDPTAVSATVTSSALPGTYSIEVDSLGSSTTTLSGAGSSPVTDPSTGNISSSSSFTLTVNGHDHQISPSGTSLQSLATAINDSNLGVQATIVNVGSSSSPDYRLAVASNQLGADTIQLSDGTNTGMLTTLAPGTDASYKVAGSSTSIQSNSRQVTLAPGVTVDLLQQSTAGQPVTITVAKNSLALQSGLSSFASAYNAGVDAVNAQRGQTAGALEGQSLVFSLQNVLASISQYGSSGAVGSLSALGLSLDQTGHLSFDATAFNNQSTSAIQQFLGTTTSGGFLKVANDALTSMADANTGVIQSDISSLQDRITSQNTRISQEQTRIDDLTTQLQQRLTAADAAVASLQAQKSYFSQLFQAQYPANANTTNA
jgi:flagellar hook-associated protein 2